MPPPNPNRLSRRYIGLMKSAANQHNDDKALGARVRELLAEYDAARVAMVAELAAMPSKAEAVAQVVAELKAERNGL